MSECKQELHVGDVGTQLEVEVLENCLTALDISAASVKEITIKRPDYTTVNKTAIFTTSGVDGLIYFETAVGDLTLEGTYYIQVYLELPFWQGYSNVGQFEVHDNL